MTRGTLAVAVVAAGVVLVAGGLLAAQDNAKDRPVRTLSAQDIGEKLDGKATKATTVELTLTPGYEGEPHRHPGPVFGYVLEGEFEWAIDDNPVKILKAGDTFYEPTRCLHRVSRNPSKTAKTRVLALLLHPADVENLVLPADDKN